MTIFYEAEEGRESRTRDSEEAGSRPWGARVVTESLIAHHADGSYFGYF
jgi:hypothetical protein